MTEENEQIILTHISRMSEKKALKDLYNKLTDSKDILTVQHLLQEIINLRQENNILKEKIQIAQNSDKKTVEILRENLHLKEQLEPFKDEYFKGLTNGTIAGLAKKSIRMTAENTKYTNFLEWLLTQQYYILPPKIKTRINEVLNETAK